MRSFWSRTPMLRIVIALMAGIGAEIAADNVLHASVSFSWVMFALLVISGIFQVIVICIKDVTLSYRLRIYNGLALNASVLAFSFILTWFHAQKNYQDHFSNFLSDKNLVVAQIVEPPTERDKIIMAVGEVSEVRNESGSFKTHGKLLLDFAKDSITEMLEFGDVVLLRSKIDRVRGPGNPNEFSYKDYYGFQNIYHQTYLRNSDWELVASGKGNFLFSAVYKLRDSFLQIIRRYVKDKDDFGVAAATMLGYRNYISPDLMRAYASAGTFRVLSISGLHVGIMFLMLNFLLKWMDKRGRNWLIAKSVLVILFIWFYACLTGLTLPVQRSALMFSLIQAGRVMARNVNIYNIIAASAILLMLLDPFVLADVGFQFSYIAVLGIVYLQPKIAKLIIIHVPEEAQYKKQKNIFSKTVRLLRYDLKWLVIKGCDGFWQLTAASIAAQIALFPLGVVYFYQFPNLFLLSNLVVVPLSSLVLFTGTALFAVGHIPYLGDITGWTFQFLLMVLDKFILWLNGLPYAQTTGICISGSEMVLMYGLIFLLCWFAEEKKPRVLIASLVLILGLCSFHSYRSFNWANKKEIVVYDVPKHRAMAFIAERKVFYDFDDSLSNDNNALINHIYHHWWESGVREEIAANPNQLAVGKIILFEGKKILIVDSVYSPMSLLPKTKLKTDLLILTGNPQVSLTQLKNFVDFSDVVFDSSNKPKRIQSWEDECNKLDIYFWDVNKRGAYLWDL